MGTGLDFWTTEKSETSPSVIDVIMVGYSDYDTTSCRTKSFPHTETTRDQHAENTPPAAPCWKVTRRRGHIAFSRTNLEWLDGEDAP